MDSETLQKTITKWNKYCAAGKDPEFGTEPNRLLPLKTPPYYAQPLLPAGMATYGGPKRNAQSQVVDTNNMPIPRLYAAGELGSVYFIQPAIGSAIGEAFAFGRIAGRNAAAETHW